MGASGPHYSITPCRTHFITPFVPDPYCAIQPPSTTSEAPVVYAAAGEAR